MRGEAKGWIAFYRRAKAQLAQPFLQVVSEHHHLLAVVPYAAGVAGKNLHAHI